MREDTEKRYVKFLGILIAVLTAIPLLFASAYAEMGKRFDDTTQTCRTITLGNYRHGYKKFIDLCKKCHNQKNEEGKFLYSESKTPKAWNRVFFEKYPKCAKNGAWTALSIDDQLQMNDFLFITGALTYDPNDATTCG